MKDSRLRGNDSFGQEIIVMIERKKTVCMWCHSHCKVVAKVENGRLIGMEGDKDHPSGEMLTRTVMACPRARAVVDYFYNKERLNYPLKRIGQRGESKWQQISWEQAFDEIAGKLGELRDKYGPETLAFTRGTYRNPREFTTRFFNDFFWIKALSLTEILMQIGFWKTKLFGKCV